MVQKKKTNYPIDFVSMFREYDIRGRVNPTELNEKSVYKIVRAYAEYIKKIKITKCVLGYDNRDCSPAFCESAKKALLDAGVDVYYIGLSLSPVVYWAQYHFKAKGCVMITASHNPNGWSGFKLGCGYSKTLCTDEINTIFNSLDEKFSAPVEKGKLVEKNVRDLYINDCVSRIKMGKYKPRVLIETANGGTGLFAYEIFQKLGCTTFLLNADPDITYPRYFPNPSNMQARQKMTELVNHPYVNADLAIFFDGDGDRIGVVDENGKNVWSDILLAILSIPTLKQKKGASIVFDVKCSRTLIETIRKFGGNPVMCSTGHSYVKNKLIEVDAEIAGERSGHIFIGGENYYGFDDALFTALKLIEFLSNSGKKLGEIVKTLPCYCTSPEIQIPCPDATKYELVKKLVAKFKELYPGKVIDINGARVELDNGWGLVRASSNLPELGLIFEGKTEQDLLEIRAIFKKVLGEFKELPTDWKNDFVKI